MSRPTKSERLALSKGRPKRRAAATHFFKYQLANNPSRAEENDLKRALQESLEEQKIAPNCRTVIDSKCTNKSRLSNNHNINGRVINSSTNSSDVSKSSNISSSTNSDNSGGPLISAKRTRSSAPSTSITTPSSCKRAKTIDNFTHSPINKNTKNECDSEPSVLSGELTMRPNVGKAIRTYSRNQSHSNGQQEQTSMQQLKQTCDSGPRSSTPKQRMSSERKTNGIQVVKEVQSYVSKSTQTSPPEMCSSKNTKLNKQIDIVGAKLTDHLNKVDQVSKTASNSIDPRAPIQPVQQYLKFKRESKNYAYAKMTALRVNTMKSPSSNSKSSKKSPNLQKNGVLNNNNTNKDSTQTNPNSVTNNNSFLVRANSGIILVSDSNNSTNHKTVEEFEAKSERNKASSSSSTQKSALSNNFKSSDCLKSNLKHHKQFPASGNRTTVSSDKLPHIDAINQGLKRELNRNESSNLSTVTNFNQDDLNVFKKRAAQGSWSLLGIPEEKVIYLRDDEPPRRLICYPAIKHAEGDVIQVRDSVLLRSGAKKTDLPYIAKVCAFWEDAETGSIMMSLFWYYRPEHTEEGRVPHHLPDEIFASRHRDVDSVECIEDKCYVLTFNEYCRYRKRCKMEQVNTTWSLIDVTIPVSNESYPRRNRIPDVSVNPELVFCCRQIYDSRMRRLIKNPLINTKYGHI